MSGTPRSSTVLFFVMAALGGLGVGSSFLLSDLHRFWANWLLWFLFLLTIGLGSLFIVALEHLVSARWSVPIRRAPERLSSLILILIPVALIALLSLPVLYPWATPEGLERPLIAGKAVWLNIPFFAARLVVCLVLWALAYRIFVVSSLEQDENRDPWISVRSRRFAPIFMIIFGLSITVVAFDWISSLEPEWYSDIFGVYVFAGSFLASLAAATLAVIYLMNRGRLPGVRSDHLYNLGGFLFAFTVFWSYIGFAQYLLIWYANLPEEVYWFRDRTEGLWLWLVLALAVLHFLIPFFALIPRDAKGDPKRLRWVALLVLFAHALDLYWLIFPQLGKFGEDGSQVGLAGPVFGWVEVSFALFFGGLALLWIQRSMSRGADMPVGDPFLREGLEFHL